MIDLSRLVAGNMMTLQLADFGADVIKIEPRAGDTLRNFRAEGFDTWWKTYGRNKRSVALDLRTAGGVAIVKALAREADALVESFRAGTLEKMGLGRTSCWISIHGWSSPGYRAGDRPDPIAIGRGSAPWSKATRGSRR